MAGNKAEGAAGKAKIIYYKITEGIVRTGIWLLRAKRLYFFALNFKLFFIAFRRCKLSLTSRQRQQNSNPINTFSNLIIETLFLINYYIVQNKQTIDIYIIDGE